MDHFHLMADPTSGLWVPCPTRAPSCPGRTQPGLLMPRLIQMCLLTAHPPMDHRHPLPGHPNMGRYPIMASQTMDPCHPHPIRAPTGPGKTAPGQILARLHTDLHLMDRIPKPDHRSFMVRNLVMATHNQTDRDNEKKKKTRRMQCKQQNG